MTPQLQTEMKTVEEILSEYATWAEKIDGNRRQALINAIEEYAAQFQQEWIDVKTPPKDDIKVLAVNNFGIPVIVVYDSLSGEYYCNGFAVKKDKSNYLYKWQYINHNYEKQV